MWTSLCVIAASIRVWLLQEELLRSSGLVVVAVAVCHLCNKPLSLRCHRAEFKFCWNNNDVLVWAIALALF